MVTLSPSFISNLLPENQIIRKDKTTNGDVLVRVSITVMKHNDQKFERKWFMQLIHYSSSSKEISTGNWTQEVVPRYIGPLFTGLALMISSPSFVKNPVPPPKKKPSTTSPGIALLAFPARFSQLTFPPFQHVKTSQHREAIQSGVAVNEVSLNYSGNYY